MSPEKPMVDDNTVIYFIVLFVYCEPAFSLRSQVLIVPSLSSETIIDVPSNKSEVLKLMEQNIVMGYRYHVTYRIS